jgi:class 3 adenylate cyclase
VSLFKKRTQRRMTTADQTGERRQLTVLFYDIVGSTSLIADDDPEALRAALNRIHDIARAVLTDHGGSLEQLMGDGGMAYFGYPVVTEDAALQAVSAAMDLLAARAEIPNAPDIRIGIATGVVVLGDMQGASGGDRLGAIGAAPNLAARLEAACAVNDVLVGPSTYALTHRAVQYRTVDNLSLKGFDDVTRGWAPVALKDGASRFQRQRDTASPFTGRQTEIARLAALWDDAINGHGAALLLEGEPGIGKSRIVTELMRHAGTARVVVVQGQPRTGGDALHAIIQMYERAHEDGTDRPLSDAAVATAETLAELEDDDSLPPAARRIAILSCVADGLIGLTRDRPLLLLAEDLHWFDEVSLAVIKRLAEDAARHPLLLLATSRPDPALGPLRAAFAPLDLVPLEGTDAAALVRAIATADLTDATVEWVIAKADGNPLFLVELTLHASDVAKAGSALNALNGADVGSLRDLLATRLETVGDARRTAQVASVIGRDFPYHILARLATDRSAQLLDDDLQRLNDHGLQDPVDNGYVYAFRHALIRDVAYDSQLRAVRRALHDKIIDIVDRDPDLAEDVPDIVLAEHCLAAGRMMRGLELLLVVAEEAIRRSAISAPRAMLDRVLGLSAELDPGADRDLIRLRAIALLGPLVTLLEGPRAAAPLYDQGQTLYFAMTPADRAPFFPILWGWWFTASDLVEQTRRSNILIRDVTPDADPESRLQALHCGWATLFDGGAHHRCLSAIDDGLALYDPETARRSRYLYGHDARVCGLGERSLSGWLTGRLDLSAAALRGCEDWADETEHLGSRLHGLDIAMQVAVFRHDLPEIDRILTKIAALSDADAAPAIRAKRQIFGGWMAARAGDSGQADAVQDGLRTLRGLGVLEDTPFYADIAAEVAAAHGPVAAALGPLNDEIAASRATGLTYWLPELLRRKAVLVTGADAARALDDGFAVAQAQAAHMLSLRNVATRLDLGLAVPPDHAAYLAEHLANISDCALKSRVADALAP